jgi:hypothetical protein
VSSLRYFPRPFPDEILYSIIARYFRNTLSTSPKKLTRELFNTQCSSATIDLPSHLLDFSRNTTDVFRYTVDEIIDKFTLYPYYHCFLTHVKRKYVLASIKGNFASNIHTRVGVNASKSTSYRYPVYCPICLRNDINEYGEGYWHRSHQIPDMLICHLHNCHLKKYIPDLHELNRALFLPAPLVQGSNRVETNSNPTLILLARKAFEILNNKNFDINQVRYLEQTVNLGYCQKNILDVKSLITDFRNFYGEAYFTKYLKCSKNGTQYQWIPGIVKRPFHIFHPVRHILMNEFLISTMAIEPKRGSKHPFGVGPWPCLNPACNHYKKPIIKSLAVHTDAKTKRQIGTFACDCGYTYTKSFVELSNGTVEPFIRVKERGGVWKSKLEAELKTKKSFRAIAKLLCTDAKTVSMYFKNKSKKVKLQDSEKINSQRKMWLKFLSRFSLSPVRMSRDHAPHLYSWLYRNDQRWLLNTNRTFHTRRKIIQRVDWPLLDKQLLTRLKISVDMLAALKTKKRITKTLLSKMINNEKHLLTRNIFKLPRCKAFFKTHCETIKAAQTKRLKSTFIQLQEKEQLVKEWKLLRGAGLPQNVNHTLKREIDKLYKTFQKW